MNRLTPAQALDKILARSVADDVTGCWTWQGPCLDSGYPKWSIWGEQFAHRIAYIAAHGPILGGLQVDHACHNRDANCSGGPSCMHRRCVNPDHLEAVTSRTNLLRSPNSIAGINARRTECKWGHPFDAENTTIQVAKTGQRWRRCRRCATRRRLARQRPPIAEAA